MKSQPKPEARRDVDVDDVDDIIGIAAKRAEDDERRLGMGELKEIGRELGVPPERIEKAAAELERRRAEEAEREAARRKARRALALKVGVGTASAFALLLILASFGQRNLAAKLSEVESRKAQIENVVERRARVEARLKHAPASPDKEAELSGSDNRVAVERRRYDQAAAAYNEAARSFPSSLWAKLFGMPPRVPLSNEPAGK